MPVQKFSAMDPSGSWNMDARDQTAMWNADRGDRINMWQTNRADNGGRDAWQRDVALAKLGLDREMYQGTREDNRTGADRHYGYLEKQLGADQERYKSRDAREQAAHELDMRTRNLEITGREEDDFAMDTVDYKALGFDDKTAAAVNAMPRSVRKQFLANSAGRSYEAMNRPQDRRDAGDAARADEAAAIIASIQGKDTVTPVEKQRLALARSEREKQGYGAGLGVDPQDATAAEHAKTQLEAISKSAKEAASGIFGIVTQSERDALKKQASELLRVLKRAGYQDSALNEVWSQIESDLKQTQTGLLGDTFMSPGWTSSDIDEARRGFR